MYKPSQPRLRLNNLIRVPEVRAIGPNGEQLGVLPMHEVLKLAEQYGMDAVEIGPTSKPPVVKIMDYGRYMYQQERSQKKSPKSAVAQHGQEVKTVQIGFKTQEHDLHIRATQAMKFLEKGYRVKVDMRLRGREKGMSAVARPKMELFLKLIPVPYEIDSPVKNFPGGLDVLIRASKAKK